MILSLADKANVSPLFLNWLIDSPIPNEIGLQNMINLDLLRITPMMMRLKINKLNQFRRVPMSARAKRRAAFARIQSLYKTSKSGCTKVVLDGKWTEPDPSLPIEDQLQFRKLLFQILCDR